MWEVNGTMGHGRFADIVGDISPERRARIDAIKEEARADAVAFNLAELRRHRELTQVELAERLEKAQGSISAMEAAWEPLQALRSDHSTSPPTTSSPTAASNEPIPTSRHA